MLQAKRGQGAFEYILMLSGVLLIVILIIFILQGTLSGTNNTMSAQQDTFNSSVSADIIPQYTQCIIATSKTGSLTGATYPCCVLNGGTAGTAAGQCSNSAMGCAGVTTSCAPTTLSCPTSKFDRKTGRCA